MLNQIESLEREKEMLSHALADRAAELQLQANKTQVWEYSVMWDVYNTLLGCYYFPRYIKARYQ